MIEANRLIDAGLEAAVIGSMLRGGEPVFREADLSDSDFATERGQVVFRAIRELADEVNPTLDAVAHRLIEVGDIDRIGGLAGLVDIDAAAIPGLRIAGLCNVLRELGRKRRAWRLSELIGNEVALGAIGSPERITSLATELAELAAGDPAKGGLRIENLPAVCAESENICYIREPELPKSSVIALTGDSGSGKSTLATAFIRDAVEQGIPSLILDRESPRAVAADRMRRLGFGDSELLRWWGGWMGDVPSLDGGVIRDWVRSCEPKPIIVIDSLIAFLESDENDSSAMRKFMNGARRLADVGATCVVVHHDGKSETARDYRGSSDFKAAVDQAFHVSNISSDSKLDRLSLRCFKSRYGFTGSTVYFYADGRFVRDDRAAAPAIAIGEQLTSLLRTHPCIKRSDFENKAVSLGIGRARARQYMDDGVLAGSVHMDPGPQNAKRYSLIDQNVD